MNTGDAELLDPSDLAHWSRHYGHRLADVHVLALPHHGSDKNSDAALQGLCPEALLTAHVKRGAAKHPGVGVTAAAGDRLVEVTEDPDTAVRMTFES